jgi:hypothetical protein
MWTKIASGETVKGEGWENYPIGSSDANSRGITIYIDTSFAHFDSPPRYFTSLGGHSWHWSTTGVTSIYETTNTGFRVYVRWANGGNLNRQTAVDKEWYINWFAVEDDVCRGGNPPIIVLTNQG